MVHYQNVDTPERCLIRLYKFYIYVCPKNRPDDAFYLKPLVCRAEVIMLIILCIILFRISWKKLALCSKLFQ